jgi:hypothetical protein
MKRLTDKEAFALLDQVREAGGVIVLDGRGVYLLRVREGLPLWDAAWKAWVDANWEDGFVAWLVNYLRETRVKAGDLRPSAHGRH